MERRIETALKEWFDVTASGSLTDEIQGHIVRELRLRIDMPEGAAEVASLQGAFQLIAAAVLQDGLPANGNAEQPWRVAEARQRNSEAMIWAVLNACALARAASADNSFSLNIKWPDAFAFGDLLRRLSSQSQMGESLLRLQSVRSLVFPQPAMSCFAYIVADGADLTGQTLFGIDLRHANLRGVRLEHASMVCCDVGAADLSGAKLSWASIYGSSFDGTVLKGTKLVGARLTGSPLHNADVTDADLAEATVQEVADAEMEIRSHLFKMQRERWPAVRARNRPPSELKPTLPTPLRPPASPPPPPRFRVR